MYRAFFFITIGVGLTIGVAYLVGNKIKKDLAAAVNDCV